MKKDSRFTNSIVGAGTGVMMALMGWARKQDLMFGGNWNAAPLIFLFSMT